MFSLTKIVAFALLALAPYASATPEPAPNAIEVAARAAPTTDIVKLMTDTKADLQAACAQITSSPSTVTAALVSSVAAQINVTLTATAAALTSEVLSGVTGDVTVVVGLLVDIIALLTDTINTVPSTVAGVQAALTALVVVVNTLVSQLVTKLAGALSNVVTGVGASLVGLAGCIVKSSGEASQLTNLKLTLVLQALGLTA